MPLSLNNSKDIVANSVSVIKGNRTIDLVETIDALQGFAPETLNSLEKLATAMNNDPSFFTTFSAALSDKADKSTTYTRTVTNSLLDAKVDDTEMVNYAVKTEVTTALNTKHATLTAGTASTGSQAILSASIIKNIALGTGVTLSSDANKIVITGIDAYTKTEVNQKISDLVGTAPALLNTLQEISASINNDNNLSTTMINSLAQKANITDTFLKTTSANDISLMGLGNYRHASYNQNVNDFKYALEFYDNIASGRLPNYLWNNIFNVVWEELRVLGEDLPILFARY